MIAVTEVLCIACDEHITGTFSKTYWGPFHPHHQQCEGCQFPISGSTDRTLCSHCQATAVTEIAEAQGIVNEVHRQLSTHRSIGVGLDIELRLVDRTKLGEERLGQARLSETTRDGSRTSVAVAIDLREAMPATLLAGVAAHELTHAWLWAHNVRPTDIVSEGVAELSCFWILGRINDRIAMAQQETMRQNRHRVYGAGYRLARAAEQEHGWATTRQHLISSASLPSTARHQNTIPSTEQRNCAMERSTS